jgi:SulP family sulfate permease
MDRCQHEERLEDSFLIVPKERLYNILTHLSKTHFLTLAVGRASIALLFCLERHFRKLPATLIVMLLGIILSSLFAIEQQGVHVVDEIPAGLAPLKSLRS